MSLQTFNSVFNHHVRHGRIHARAKLLVQISFWRAFSLNSTLTATFFLFLIGNVRDVRRFRRFRDVVGFRGLQNFAKTLKSATNVRFWSANV
uniref:Pe38 protein n=1 Tax=Spilarctia obliqua nucleopolyhedrovirus TaxID=1638618 RepID=A0A7G9U864_9ABAC|nr:Pe38 protein [Spilarctia obliqua nucleopolyhedrovirus]